MYHKFTTLKLHVATLWYNMNTLHSAYIQRHLGFTQKNGQVSQIDYPETTSSNTGVSHKKLVKHKFTTLTLHVATLEFHTQNQVYHKFTTLKLHVATLGYYTQNLLKNLIPSNYMQRHWVFTQNWVQHKFTTLKLHVATLGFHTQNWVQCKFSTLTLYVATLGYHIQNWV